LDFGSKPVKQNFCSWALTNDVEFITKDPGTYAKIIRAHVILVISSGVPECIEKMGTHKVDDMLGADPKEL